MSRLRRNARNPFIQQPGTDCLVHRATRSSIRDRQRCFYSCASYVYAVENLQRLFLWAFVQPYAAGQVRGVACQCLPADFRVYSR